MRRLLVSIAVITAVSVAAIALGQGFKKISEILTGYEETAATGGGAVSTTGNGTFTARISNDESRIDWELSYTDLEGAVQQAHIHFGQKAVTGPISVFLCTNLGNGPAGTQPCPAPPATISGTITAVDVTNLANERGISAGQLDELIRVSVAHNALMDLEELEEVELEKFRKKYQKLAAAARKSLEIRGDNATGWGLGWRLNLWARLHDGEHAYTILERLLSPERTYPNMFDAHPPFQIDGNFGGTSAIAEMLLQGDEDEIRLLPAPPDAWPNGRVTGLRAPGGFEIDLAWKGGALERTTVRSLLGHRLRLRRPRARERLSCLPAPAARRWSCCSRAASRARAPGRSGRSGPGSCSRSARARPRPRPTE